MTSAALRPLALPLLAALALHALWLAGSRLPRQQPGQVRGSTPADDTPQLVRLARRLSLEQSLRVATPLPPPPLVAAPAAPPLPRPGAGSRQPVRQPVRPAARRTDRPKARTAIRQATRPAARPASVPGRATTAQGPPDAGQAAPQALLQSLWDKAEPAEDPPAPLASLPAAAQLRQLDGNGARRLGLGEPPATPQRIRGDLLLIWTHADQFWLLRLPVNPGPGDAGQRAAGRPIRSQPP